ncbi:MAG: AraC family transcriptional regulator [Clostridiaceae bacterium]
MDKEKNKFKEAVAHGSPMFPLYVYSDRHINSKSSLYYHWHEEIEIIYVEKGEFILNVDMTPIKAKEGECYFINSEQLHSAYGIRDYDSLHHAIVFDLNILSSSIYDNCQSKFIDPLINKQYLFPLCLNIEAESDIKIISQVKDIISTYKDKNAGWELSIKSSLLKIISLMVYLNKFSVQENLSLTRDNYKIELIKKSINYIHLNYGRKIYLQDLAKEINMNKEYFCRFFKYHTGKTPVDYINYYRIEQAAKILKTQDKKILDICLQVGFENFSYFIKKFKEYKNCTPSKFK